MKEEIQDTIPVGKPFRIKGDDHSLFHKGEQNQLRVFLRAEGFWVVYPHNRQWQVWKAIEKKGIEFVDEPPKYRTWFGKKVLARFKIGRAHV